MEIRHPVHPEHMTLFDTADMRDNFVIDELFVPDTPKLVYSFFDRLIVGGVCPVAPLSLDVDPAIIGSSFLLERRELGVINVGGRGAIVVDGESFSLDYLDGLYVGKGAESIKFSSDQTKTPARFYLLSAPAHASYPTTKISRGDTENTDLGDAATANERTIRKYVHPDGVKSCQLVFGVTTLQKGSIWNTMPTHTHQRRMEAYFYFDLEEDNIVFHFMGEPTETRHLIMRNEEAALSPSWSIHSGAGTSNYSFIWGMAGENQDFGDMDHVPMSTLK